MDYVVGLGSNLGSRSAQIEAGLELIAAEPGYLVHRISANYESAPIGPPQPRYLNAAARITGPDSPLELLTRLHAIEMCLGRNRMHEARWGPRSLDLDILWAAQPVHRPELDIPHPRLRERWFALRPLLDVAPELEPEYQSALAALGDEPLLVWPAAALGEVRATGRRIEVTCQAPDLAEALAGGMTALGRHLTPRPSLARAICRIVAGSSRPGHEPASFVRSVLETIAREGPFARATVCGLLAGRFSGRLLTPGAALLPVAEAAPIGAQFLAASRPLPALRLVLSR